MDKYSVLIVEDEEAALKVVSRMYARRGYLVFNATNYQEAIDRINDFIPDLLVLDIMLPDGSGYDICKHFRTKSKHPVIFLTGKSEVSDKVEALEKGGDYYLTKPYDPEELLAVSNRLLERLTDARNHHEELKVINKGCLVLDVVNNKAYVKDEDINLTSKEFALLLLLVQNEDKIISPNEIYSKIWGQESLEDTRTIRFHITNLKRKLGCDNSNDYDIVSIYSKGYMFTRTC